MRREEEKKEASHPRPFALCRGVAKVAGLGWYKSSRTVEKERELMTRRIPQGDKRTFFASFARIGSDEMPTAEEKREKYL